MTKHFFLISLLATACIMHNISSMHEPTEEPKTTFSNKLKQAAAVLSSDMSSSITSHDSDTNEESSTPLIREFRSDSNGSQTSISSGRISVPTYGGMYVESHEPTVNISSALQHSKSMAHNQYGTKTTVSVLLDQERPRCIQGKHRYIVTSNNN